MSKLRVFSFSDDRISWFKVTPRLLLVLLMAVSCGSETTTVVAIPVSPSQSLPLKSPKVPDADAQPPSSSLNIKPSPEKASPTNKEPPSAGKPGSKSGEDLDRAPSRVPAQEAPTFTPAAPPPPAPVQTPAPPPDPAPAQAPPPASAPMPAAASRPVPPPLFTEFKNPPKPKLSVEELQFIGDINQIIADISDQPFSYWKIREKFSSAGNSVNEAEIMLFGEDHTHVESLLDQMRAIESLVKSGDVVLYEAAGNKEPGKQLDCNIIIFKLFIAKEWIKLGRKYNVDEHLELQKKHIGKWSELYFSFDLKKLNIGQARCYLWDKESSFKDDRALERGIERNASMVNEIKKHHSPGRRVFINAGYRHLPSGDVEWFKSLFQMTPNNVSAAKGWFNLELSALNRLEPFLYYPLLSRTSDSAESNFRTRSGYGATKVIYDFIKNNNYVELIPSVLLKNKTPCLERCD